MSFSLSASLRIGACRLANFKQDFKHRSHLRRWMLWRRTRDSIEGISRCPIQTSHSSRSSRFPTPWLRRDGGGCVTRRFGKMAAASMGRRTSAATPATAWFSRRSEKILPRDAVWYASSLKRTHQTADAIWAAGFPKPAAMPREAALAEQHLGEWQGMNRAAFIASRPIGSHWFADINDPCARRRKFHGSLQPCARRDRADQRRTSRQGRSLRSRMAAPSRPRSGLRSAISRKKASPSTSTIVR